MKVTFTNPDEFIEELKKDKEKVVWGIVRLTTAYKPTKISSVYTVEVVSTYRKGDEIIELRKFCGDVWSNLKGERAFKEEEKAFKVRDSIYEKIENACQELGIEVRAGIYE